MESASNLSDLLASKAREEAQHTSTPPDYMDWVLGWRNFDINDEGLCASLFTPYKWHPGENRAQCSLKNDGSVIHSGHHCGLNAFYEPHSKEYGTLRALVRGRGERFAIHPDGFRAEYSEILAFVGGRSPSEQLKKAAEIYKVPLFKRRWQAVQYAKKEGLGEWFPKDRRPKSESIFAPEREVDWNEVPIGDMSSLLTRQYMFIVGMLWICVLAGFIYGAINIGGIV